MSGSGLATNFSCNNYFNRVYFCASSWPRGRPAGSPHALTLPPAASYQFQRYYRTGGFDDCSEAFEDLSTCMKIKISKDEDAKVRAGAGDAIILSAVRLRALGDGCTHARPLYALFAP